MINGKENSTPGEIRFCDGGQWELKKFYLENWVSAPLKLTVIEPRFNYRVLVYEVYLYGLRKRTAVCTWTK